MVHGCAEISAAAPRADVFDAVYSAMRAQPGEASLQFGACMALDELSSLSLQPDAIAAAARGVTLVVSALKTHEESSSMPVGIGIRVLHYVLKIGNEEAQTRAAEAGGISWIVNYMRNCETAVTRHYDVPSTSHFRLCCYAILAWIDGPSDSSAEHRAKCITAGTIEAVVATMLARHTESLIQILGCGVLISLCGNAPEQTRAGKAGAIDVIVRSMRIHAADSDVQLSCMNALECISRTMDVVSNALKVVAGWPEVVHAMQTHLNNDPAGGIQRSGICLLLNTLNCVIGDVQLRAKADHSVARLVSLGALEAVSRTLLTHHTDAGIQMAGPLVLLLICAAVPLNPTGVGYGTGPMLKRHGARAARAGVSAALRAAVAAIRERGITRSAITVYALLLADELDALPLRACDGCGATDAELKLCSRCLSARFCSAECQRRTWSTHRQVCRAPAAPVADAAPTSG